ncbi:Factor-induced protein [Wickerhamomyces ciferrii]|uniref:Factor-induced protein n=1 Tax=Wickerhamomyces ciferrii (strain ATCC 14091 / BCRC 22168 / CBS 111 / JCM 3599 / NBRC 0793 / NRRL Y-1031 F-60-10) TaxID=1206466 RepID=K0KM39_WICCF|nr:Factor-induced protein [Wickerhamomyces ciferrii]CCH46300.1 Factor-induced protein [Wickerhamomyces ciferrii]
MILTTVWFALKRMPRSTTQSSTYSSIYLIKYQFNKSSSLYPLIKSNYAKKNLTDYESLKVTSGYMGICVHLKDDITCTSKSNVSQFGQTSIPLYTSSSNSSSTDIDLVRLGSEFSNEINHPYVLIATIILTLILFLTLLYITVPGLPMKTIVNKINLVLAPAITLLWGLGSMWAHVAQHAGKNLVQSASMDIVMAHVGRKAAAMTWTPFSFFLIITIGIVALHLRDLKRQIEEVDPKV